jgi:hypothetical protein
MVTVAAVLLARTQELVRVMVITWPSVAPFPAAQVPVKPEAKVTVGVGGRINPGPNWTEMVLGAARAPPAEDVRPTVQVEVALARFEPGVKVTAVTGAADATPWPTNGAAKPAITTAGRRSRRTRRTNGVIFDRASRSIVVPLAVSG